MNKIVIENLVTTAIDSNFEKNANKLFEKFTKFDSFIEICGGNSPNHYSLRSFAEFKHSHFLNRKFRNDYVYNLEILKTVINFYKNEFKNLNFFDENKSYVDFPKLTIPKISEINLFWKVVEINVNILIDLYNKFNEEDENDN